MLNHNDHRVPSSAIRRDFGRLLGMAGLVLAASAFIAPPLAGALRLADQHFAAQAVLSQEDFSGIRGNAGRASLTVAEAR